jgi:hypothetical protein
MKVRRPGNLDVATVDFSDSRRAGDRYYAVLRPILERRASRAIVLKRWPKVDSFAARLAEQARFAAQRSAAGGSP